MTKYVKYDTIVIAFQIGEERVNDMSDTVNSRASGKDAYEAGKDEVTFKIIEHIGVLRTSAAGWSRELNYISWCDRPARFDIREWTPDHSKSSRGITLTDYEMGKICEWMSKRKQDQEGM